MAHIAWGKIEQGQQALQPFWEKLILNSHSLIFLNKLEIKNFQELPLAWVFRLNKQNKISYFFLIALLPLWWAVNVLLLFIHRQRFQLDSIVLCTWEDKLLLSRPAKILGLKIIWLFMPTDNTETRMKKLIKQSKNIKILCFSPTCLANLEKAGFSTKQTHLLPLGVPGKDLKLQGTIFSELAEQDKKNSLKKFFSIVTVLDLDQKTGLEQLFTAIQKTLTVFNNLQLVVIGDGKERQNLKWLADKKGLGNIVWFVGKQKYLNKWFRAADLYVSCSNNLELDDCWYCLKAATANLPLVLPGYSQLEDFFTDQKNAYFYELNDTETLAQAIINLKQKQSLRLRLRREAKASVDNNFELAKMVESFEKLLP